jgi:hypothetical protein
MAKQTGQPSPPEGTTDAPNLVVEELKGIIAQKDGLIEVLSKQIDNLVKALTASPSQPEVVPKTTMEVIQINAGGKKYFCKTPEEQAIFDRNNPGVITETFKIEMEKHIAQKYFDDPENKKAFEEEPNEQA